MIEDKTYYTSILTWLSVLIIFFIFTALAGAPPPEVFYARFALVNTLGAVIFLAIYEVMFSLNFDFKNENNFTKKDLTFLFILIFGPFALLPVVFVIIACADKPARKFEGLVAENQTDLAANAVFNYIDVADEFQKQMFKEAVIDSAMSDNNLKKRNAIDILSKMKNKQAVAALKLMARDKEYEIRFMAINKLNVIEDEYMREFDWYKTAIKVCGPVPELVFQYASLILKFCRLEILYDDLAHLYYKKSASLFKALIDENIYRDESLYGYSVCLRSMSDAARAAALLESDLKNLSGRAVDELAACYFELKKNEELKALIQKVKNNEINCGARLKKIIDGSDQDQAEDGSESGDLYSVYKMNEFLQLIKNCESLDFDVYYARLKTAANTSMYPAAFKDICKMSKFCRVIYLKLLKGQLETDNARNLKRFLYDPDIMLSLFALDVLSSTELPLRNEIFIDLLLHPQDEVKIVAIKFAGMKKMRKAVKLLIRLLKASKISLTLKKETATALLKIADSQAVRGISHCLSKGVEELRVHALSEIKKYNLRYFLDDILKIASNGTVAERLEALKTAASFGGDAVFFELEKFLQASNNDIIREAATVEFCRAFRPEAIANAVFYYNKTGSRYETDYKNYFSYLGKNYIESYIDGLISSGSYAETDFIKTILKFRYETVSEIIASRGAANSRFYEYCKTHLRSEDNNG